MNMTTTTEFSRDLAQLANRLGYSMTKTASNHWKLVHPAVSTPVFAASTPSDHRAIKNVESMLQRFVREAKSASSSVDAASEAISLNATRVRSRCEPFEQAIELVRTNAIRHVYTARCGCCRKVEAIKTNSNFPPLPPTTVSARFRALGWSAHTRRAEDRCGSCIGKPPQEAVSTVTLPQVAQKLTDNITSRKDLDDAPKLPMVAHAVIAGTGPSRQLRRQVIATISKHYVEGAGYIGGASDKTIADKHGIAAHWVESLRDTFFGSTSVDGKPAEIQRTIAELSGELVRWKKQSDATIDMMTKRIDLLSRLLQP